MSFPQKRDALTSLVAEMTKASTLHPYLGTFKEQVLPLINEAQTQRNKVVHCLWMMDGKDVSRASVSARKSLKFDLGKVPISDIEKSAEAIYKAAAAASWLLTKSYDLDEISFIPQSGQKLNTESGG